MYSEAELDAAVKAGALTPDAAASLRGFVATQHAAPNADEEHVRLLTGFNDIFVSIAITLVLVALTWIARAAGSGVAGAVVAAASWGLAEYFTRRRRMALPSILLLLSFVGGIAFLAGGVVFPATLSRPIGLTHAPLTPPTSTDWWHAAGLALIAVVTALGAWAHWRRFKVPITIAAATVAAWLAFLMLVAPLTIRAPWFSLVLLFAGGVVLFARAMAWDISDRNRSTRRSDVAFWLHLAAAPMLVHPVFSSISTQLRGGWQVEAALSMVTLYLILAAVALAVDRRALLVSALTYVLWALITLLRGAGSGSLTAPAAALVIGAVLLLLSVFWQRARRNVVAKLPPAWQNRLPVVG